MMRAQNDRTGCKDASGESPDRRFGSQFPVTDRLAFASVVALLLVVPRLAAGEASPASLAREYLESSEFTIRYNRGSRTREPKFLSLTLHVREYRVSPRPSHSYCQITPELAGRILGVLERDDFFRASEQHAKFFANDGSPSGFYYRLELGYGNLEKYWRHREILFWDLAMLKRLDSIRKVLDGEAAKQMDALLERLAPLRQEWTKAAADPEYVAAHLRSVEGQLRAYAKAWRERRKAEYPQRSRAHPLSPVIIEGLLTSDERQVVHAGLLLARDHYGRPELTPAIAAALERLLKGPRRDQRDDEASSRIVACQALQRWGDSRALPVLLKALEDTYELDGEHAYRTVWWEADEALRKITGLSPIKKPYTHVMPSEGNRVEVLAAWKKALDRRR